MTLRTPYLMFLGDAPDQFAAKTAAGIAYWRPELRRGQFRMAGCKADLGLPDMTIEDAAAAGVGTVILGVANRGGFLDYPLSDLRLAIERPVEAARLTNRAAWCVALGANTGALDPAAAPDYLRSTGDQLVLPCVDPVPSGVGPIGDRLTDWPA